eukprot:Pompholyxophrys_punicea_v1_NODE_1057_length_1004_cov_6.461538.p2 type:complete len:108 gc:universal NODE_1057_length_1004_cov_6.461538:942-619(-)
MDLEPISKAGRLQCDLGNNSEIIWEGEMFLVPRKTFSGERKRLYKMMSLFIQDILHRRNGSATKQSLDCCGKGMLWSTLSKTQTVKTRHFKFDGNIFFPTKLRDSFC